jgi:hypothetical protein
MTTSANGSSVIIPSEIISVVPPTIASDAMSGSNDSGTNDETPKRKKSFKVRSSRTISDAHLRQIEILRVMAGKSREMAAEKAQLHVNTQARLRQFEISEITELCGFIDEREVQRYLLILEGQKLVTPLPEGDFTSNRWQITTDGVRTLRTIEESSIQ